METGLSEADRNELLAIEHRLMPLLARVIVTSENTGERLAADFGVEQARAADLSGGDRSTNCSIATAILEGRHGAQRDIVLVNAAAALLAAGVATDVRDAMQRARESVDSGAAWKKVERLRVFTSANQQPETRNQ